VKAQSLHDRSPQANRGSSSLQKFPLSGQLGKLAQVNNGAAMDITRMIG
jgi:hypothetical protein